VSLAVRCNGGERSIGGREDEEEEEEEEEVREKGQGTSRMVRPHQIICCWLAAVAAAFPCPSLLVLAHLLIGSRYFSREFLCLEP